MTTRRDFDHIGNYNFMVEIDGLEVATFQAVCGLEVVTEVIEFQDGDDLITRKRPGRTAYSNVILKRGYTAREELWTWMKTVIDGVVERKAASIILLDDSAGEIVRYNLFEAWPCRWRGLELDGKSVGVAVEELELAVEKIERA